MLGNIPVIKVGDTEVEKYIQDQRKIKKSKIQSKTLVAHRILYSEVDSEIPKWFYQKVEKKQQYQVGDKFTFQSNSIQ
jgi:hypothetical protein